MLKENLTTARNDKEKSRLLPLEGTHRVCSPEETFERVKPAFAEVGITRVANVTWLDEIGIPVYQAVRPDAKTLAVSQGKGASDHYAKASAVMESIELWHVENLELATFKELIAAVIPMTTYNLDQLRIRAYSLNNPDMVIDWVWGRDLKSGCEMPLPKEYIKLNMSHLSTWVPPLFESSSNGLASGNTVGEATLHALYELVERDSEFHMNSAENSEQFAVTLESVDGASSRQLIDQLLWADVTVIICDMTGKTGIPAFSASIWSESMPVRYGGFGCHLDSDVALSRALAEAAQSRLTVIAGSREDIKDGTYLFSGDHEVARGVKERLQQVLPTRDFREVKSQATLNVDSDLEIVVKKISDYTGIAPIAIDLSRDDIGIAVVKIVAPKLKRDTH